MSDPPCRRRRSEFKYEGSKDRASNCERRQFNNDICAIVSVIIGMLSLSLISIPIFYLERISMDRTLLGESIVHNGYCDVKVLDTSISDRVKLECSFDPQNKPKHDDECYASSAIRPKLYCDEDTNSCAPYCFEKRERLGSTSYYHCTWDVRFVMLNVSIQISVSTEEENGITDRKVFEYSTLVSSGPFDSQRAVVLSGGMHKVSYCTYQTDSKGMITDAAISRVSPTEQTVFRVVMCVLLSLVAILLVIVSWNSSTRIASMVALSLYSSPLTNKLIHTAKLVLALFEHKIRSKFDNADASATKLFVTCMICLTAVAMCFMIILAALYGFTFVSLLLTFILVGATCAIAILP